MTFADGISRYAPRLLAALGTVCLLWVGAVSARAFLFDREERARWEAGGDALGAPRRGDVIGILEIPRLGFSELVAEGDDNPTLRLTLGHLPDTPFPWEPGNAAIAGHRDGRFRVLKNIRTGDHFRLRTRHGVLEYELESTHVVDPSDLSVLDRVDGRVLTLITCYPFSYVGDAPQRFVVRARAIGGAAAVRLQVSRR